ncbi:hypothetical protein CC80DRAFT_229978 [Byssothecium circinans]|uniref:Uncharacterized protein n=1 Tax=Byssothecium circinans TaxID=147558 RepID=A0A6A5U8Q9_9PLEO|nr:hypothetical protein CC80DRAFT_229978 [Byssothecium circinans]
MVCSLLRQSENANDDAENNHFDIPSIAIPQSAQTPCLPINPTRKKVFGNQNIVHPCRKTTPRRPFLTRSALLQIPHSKRFQGSSRDIVPAHHHPSAWEHPPACMSFAVPGTHRTVQGPRSTI